MSGRHQRRFRVLLAVGLVLSAAPMASAQQAPAPRLGVRGSVADSAGNPIANAMVVALHRADSVLVTFATTTGSGAFTINRLAPGDYLLQVTAVGFRPSWRPFTVGSSDLSVGTVTMQVAVTTLAEVEVNAERVPIVNRRDTLEFNALAFATRPNATVEDLLRRLPGVEVSSDGSIKAQGKDVQKVLVDGKEFFGTDPTIATKNLPADAIARVHVYEKQSDRADFTGIADGDEQTTINLVLKDDAKVGYFGRVAGGFGGTPGAADAGDLLDATGARYDGAGSLNRFSAGTQLAVIGNTNNLNQPGFSWGDYATFMGGASGLSKGGDGRDGAAPVGGGRTDGVTESLALGLNASHDFSTGTWLRSSYFLSQLDNRQYTTTNSQQLLGTLGGAYQNQVNAQAGDNLAHRLNLNAQHSFAPGHDIRLRGNLARSSSGLQSDGEQSTLSAADVLLNSGSSSYAVDGSTLEGSANLTWRKRLASNGRSLFAEVRANLSEPELTGNLDATVTLPKGSAEPIQTLQEQLQSGRTLTHTARLSLIEPLGGGKSLELFGERSATDEDQDKVVNDLTSGAPVPNTALGSGFERTYTWLRGGFRFSSNSARTRLGLGLQVQDADLNATVLRQPVEQVSTGHFRVLPSASFRVQMRPGANVDFRYTTTTREPSLNELQPYTDNTNPLNVYTGNPGLAPEYRHGFNAEYRLFDQFSFQSIFLIAGVSYTRDPIVNSRVVDANGAQALTRVNAEDGWAANAGFTFGRPIRPIGAKFNLNYRLSYTSGTEFVNAAANDSRVWSHTADLTIENRDKYYYDLRGGAKVSRSSVGYSLNSELDQSYLNSTLWGEGTVYLGDNWALNTTVSRQIYDQDLFAGENLTLWNASLSRLILDRRGEIQVTGVDLLNQNQGVSINSLASAIQEVRRESLGRYVMLKFSYRLSGGGMAGK